MRETSEFQWSRGDARWATRTGELSGESESMKPSGPPLADPRLHRFKFQRRGFQIRRPLGQVEHLHPNDLVFFVVIENHTGGYFLRLDDLGVVQAQLKRIGFLVHVQSHNLPFILQLKNTLTTRFGSTALFTATRSTRPPNSGIRRKQRSIVMSLGPGVISSDACSVRSIHSMGISRSATALRA
jgi:hypothetical protein